MSFFQELEELRLKTPRIGSIRLQNINSEYTHNTDQCKNCYLIANAVKNQDCMYGRDFYGNDDCVDCDHISDCTLCYDCMNASNCYNCTSMQDSADCSDCDFGLYIKGCHDCIGCVNIKQKQYYIFNEPYSKEEYLHKKRTLTRDEIKKKFEELSLSSPHISGILIDADNCFGDNLQHCKNAFLRSTATAAKTSATSKKAKESKTPGIFSCLNKRNCATNAAQTT
ncbi:hypothetical protein HZA42_04635 [Candidatus Peregrinibacteria bacterium]|nr:hypothetical protein [Candidatus Peregrinibacteria bacterium]